MLLLDTHIWAWSLTLEAKLSERALDNLRSGQETAVSAVTFYEISQKVRLGKWTEMTGMVDRLDHAAALQNLEVIPVSSIVAHLAGSLDWPHRDPFDRIIAATALVNGWPLISADPAFDSLIGLRRVW